MARFSERIGTKVIPKSIQLESMGEALKNSLWNEIFFRYGGERSHWGGLAQALGKDFFKLPVDQVPRYEDEGHKWVRQQYFAASWDVVYDLIEFVVHNVDGVCNPPTYRQAYYHDQRWDFLRAVNVILERELSGYRFVNGILAPISGPSEVLAIEEAASGSLRAGIGGAHEHIRSALALLGHKPDPDYRNSIKEAVSAVEAAVNSIAGTNGNGVAAGLTELKAKGVEIHGALDTAMRQLYGFTSDSGGVRHAILDQSTVGYDEAKFMLVACSAFVNFVIAKADVAGLLNGGT